MTGIAGGSEKISRHIIVGDPAERTIEHARQIGSDFLITGPAHGKVFGDNQLGSTAARIIRYANLPVLAVRRRAEVPYTSVVAGTDFSPASQLAILTGMTLFPDAQITLVHAFRISPDLGGQSATNPIHKIETEERERVIRAVKRQMADLISALGSDGSGTDKILLEGEPAEVMADYVEEHWPDLVVAGTHGNSDAKLAVIGSVAEQLLDTLPCDILAVPTRK